MSGSRVTLAAQRRVAAVAWLVLLQVAVACSGSTPSSQAPTDTVSSEPSPSAAPSASAETAIDRVKRDGVIRIGYSNERPWAYSDGEKLTGESPEMMKAFAAELGVASVDGVLVEWAGLIPALQAHRIDAIAAGMAITPERCKQVIFAEPELVSTFSLVVKKGNPKGITSWKSIAEQPATRLGIVAGSGDADYWQYNGIAEEQVVKVPDLPAMIAAVQGGRIDAAHLDTFTAFAEVEKSGDPNLEVVTPAIEDGPLGPTGEPNIGWGAVVFRTDDAALRDAFNTWLQAAKQSGALAEIFASFGVPEESIAPLGTSVDDLCAG